MHGTSYKVLSVCFLAASTVTKAQLDDVVRSHFDVYEVFLSFILLLWHIKSKISCKIQYKWVL
jgi:hypothetical protein